MIEINIFGVRDGGKIKKQIVEHRRRRRCGSDRPPCVAGDLVCLSALYAADDDGAIAAVRNSAGLRYLGVPAQHQMRAILGAADEICRAAGTSLGNVVRAHHFVGDLQRGLSGAAGVARQARRRADPVRRRAYAHCRFRVAISSMDMWAYRPGA